jgi:uncharacterized protein (DUF433 family)
MRQWENYISIDQEIRFGKPCIKGTRITVQDILSWLASGMSIAEILVDFPQLRQEQILAALAYSADKESMLKIVAA